MDRESREYRRLEKVAIVLVYGSVGFVILLGLAVLYVLAAMAVNLT